MKIKLIIILSLLSFQSFASFKDLRNLFLENNQNLQTLAMDTQKARLTSDSYFAQYDWAMSFSLGTSDSFKAALFSFQQQQTITNNVSLGLSKTFGTGTTLSFAHTVIDYDLSKWTSSPPFKSAFETANTISIKQDLGKNRFGRQNDYKDQANLLNLQTSKLSYKLSEHKTIFDFLKAYIDTRRIKTLSKLNNQALARQQKRLRQIENKYRDGISQKIDFLQSKIAVGSQDSIVRKSTLDLMEQLRLLSNLIQSEKKDLIDLNESQVSDISLRKISQNNKIEGDYTKNISYLLTKKQFELADYNLKFAQVDDNADITLNLDYSTNAYGSSYSDSFSDSKPGADFREFSASLNIVYPFGNEAVKNSYASSQLEAAKQKKLSEYKKRELTLFSRVLERKVELKKDQLKLVLSNVSLSRAALKEQNRLYNLGKTDIEQVLNSEQNLIQAETSFLNTSYEYEMFLLQDAMLKGKVVEYLNNYKE